jgi:ribosome biogenesis GTPase
MAHKRTRTASETAELKTGTVLRSGGGFYDVDVPDEDELFVCALAGLLKKGRRTHAQPVAVGDRVLVRPTLSEGENARGERGREGYIEEVLPRRSALGRGRYGKTTQITLANLDQVVIVLATHDPDFNAHRLDRFLVLAEASELPALIVLNKSDLASRREIKERFKPILAGYESLGYATALLSSETDYGILKVRRLLKNKISAVVGSSGVGKSSLINAVQPGLRLWVGDVMEIGKGRHTTTDVTLHPLDFGGYIADTPGIKTVSLIEQQDVYLPMCFPEMRARRHDCKFSNCTHRHEPGCAIQAAVAAGEIAPARYESYLKMLADFEGAGKGGRA